jgi:exonuclease SbcC
MRPTRLVIEGFTAFKEQQNIDFSDIELFAIAGPTGAGKTSILDAMQWALFGEVPRLSQNLSELISLGADKATVVFEFALRGEVFQVARKMYRTKTTEAQLDSLSPGAKNIASGVRAVNEAVVKLIGLQAKTFAMSVVLPQGKFARYFEARPAERRDLMREIYGLDFFERMRQKAGEEAQELARNVAHLQRTLGESSVSQADLDALDAELATLLSGHDVRAKAREAATTRASELDAVFGLQQQLEKKTDERDALLAKAAAIDAKRKALEVSKRSEKVQPFFRELEVAQSQFLAVKTRHESALNDRDRARGKAVEVAKALAEARTEAERIPELEANLVHLRSLEELLQSFESAAKTVKTLDADISRLLKERGDKASALEQRRNEKVATLEAAETLRARVAEMKKPIEDLAAIRALDPAARLWRELNIELDQLRSRNAAWSAEKVALNADIDAQHAGFEALDKKHENARVALRNAELELEAVKTKDLASAVREHVHVGDACPVCDQVVRVLPAASAIDLSGPQYTVSKKRSEFDAATQESASAKIRVENAEKQFAKISEDLSAGLVLLKAKESEMKTECLAFLVRYGAAESPFSEFEVALKKGAELEKEHDKMLAELATIKEKIRSLEEWISDAESILKRSGEQASELEERRTAAEESRRSIQKRLPAEVPESPAQEIAGLESRIERIRKQSESLGREEAALQASVAGLERTLEQSAKDLERAAEVSAEALLKLDEAVILHGFESRDAARLGRMDAGAVNEFELSVQEHDRSLHRVIDLLTELERQLAGRSTSAEIAASAKADLVRFQQEYDEANRRQGQLSAERAAMETTLQGLENHRARLEAQLKQHTIMSALATDLQTNQFQNFVFQDLFRELVVGASTRLLQLSQRYALEVDEDTKFWVVDQDNANEKRAIETLSGGETFLASLALALQLSQQVQDAAGALSLDSLFIDEGFGTLDPETLETVAEAVEALRDTGRVVGIITHIAELTNRLPVRIRVHKSVAGSHVEIERE